MASWVIVSEYGIFSRSLYKASVLKNIRPNVHTQLEFLPGIGEPPNEYWPEEPWVQKG